MLCILPKIKISIWSPYDISLIYLCWVTNGKAKSGRGLSNERRERSLEDDINKVLTCILNNPGLPFFVSKDIRNYFGGGGFKSKSKDGSTNGKVKSGRGLSNGKRKRSLEDDDDDFQEEKAAKQLRGKKGKSKKSTIIYDSGKIGLGLFVFLFVCLFVCLLACFVCLLVF